MFTTILLVAVVIIIGLAMAVPLPPTLQGKQTRFQEVMGELTSLRAMANRTQEQETRMAELLTEAGELRTAIDAGNAQERQFAELEAFRTEPTNIRGVFASSGNLQEDQRRAAEAAGGAGGRNDGTNERRRVGTDLVAVDMEVGGVRIDADGVGIPIRAFQLSCEDTYRRAWWNALRGRADAAERRTLEEVNSLVRSYDTGLIDPDGGYMTPPQFFHEIVSADAYPSGLIDEVTTIPCNSGSFQMLKNTYSGSSIYNAPFRKTRTSGLSGPSDQTNPPVGLLEVPISESFIKVKVPRALLEDVPALQVYLQGTMRDTYRLGTEYELSLGSGMGEPEGLLTNAGGTDGIATYNVGSTPDPAKWMKLYREVPPMYRPGAVLAIADHAYQAVESVQDANGAFPFAVLNLTQSGVTNGPAETFRRAPIRFAPFYPDYTAAAKVATWGNHKRGYYYGLRLGASMGVRNIADESFVTFVMRVRDGGKVVLPDTLRIAVAS